ncbi:MAG TPA: MBL fold metallo-hydrolase [Myxococcales bacterium]|nr:MBL fold metallo-hydrolase [Myxococcales bacterium]
MRLVAVAAVIAMVGCAAPGREPAVRGMPIDDPDASLSAVWVGHATVLLRLGRHFVLTDPNLGGNIAVVRRVTPASLKPAQLPRLDVAIVSHLHADHLDTWTLRRIGHGTEVVYPRGGESYMSGFEQPTRALAPWETMEYAGLRITAVPVRHSGGRFLVDALWNHAATGYVIEGAGRTVFFAGDTGYDPHVFKEVGRRFPAIDLALIPIAPARGGNRNHADPREALQIFEDVGARYMVPIHFEAYYSSAVPIDEPRKVLEAEVMRRGWEDRVFALRTGERWMLPDGQGEMPWVTDAKAPEASKAATTASR